MIAAMVREYELMIVMKPDFAHDDKKKLEDAVRKLVGDDATIHDVTLLGKKPLAYSIRKQTEGVFIKARIESKPLIVSDIQKRSRLLDDVLRYLLLGQQKKEKGD